MDEKRFKYNLERRSIIFGSLVKSVMPYTVGIWG